MLRLARPLDYEGVRRVMSRWDGYTGLAYFRLLLDRLEKAGYLGERPGVSTTGLAPLGYNSSID